MFEIAIVEGGDPKRYGLMVRAVFEIAIVEGGDPKRYGLMVVTDCGGVMIVDGIRTVAEIKKRRTAARAAFRKWSSDRKINIAAELATVCRRAASVFPA